MAIKYLRIRNGYEFVVDYNGKELSFIVGDSVIVREVCYVTSPQTWESPSEGYYEYEIEIDKDFSFDDDGFPVKIPDLDTKEIENMVKEHLDDISDNMIEKVVYERTEDDDYNDDER